MKQSRRLAILALACGLLSLAGSAQAIDIAVTGSWSPIIDASDLVAGAGTDLNDTYDSYPDQVLITISNTTGSKDRWRVDVRRADTTWHSDLALWVQRTGDGLGAGQVTGGTRYQEIGTTYAEFFSGKGDRTDIPIQLRVTGVSVAIPPDTYSTTVTYTVVDT